MSLPALRTFARENPEQKWPTSIRGPEFTSYFWQSQAQQNASMAKEWHRIMSSNWDFRHE
jgi:hypothetical protein